MIPPLSAPFLLRPRGDDPADARNWVLKARERTGQSPEESLLTWVEGFALEDDLMWGTMSEQLGEATAADTYREIWRRMPGEYVEAARWLLRFAREEPPFGLVIPGETPEAQRAQVLASIRKAGLSVEEGLVLWVKAFVAHDATMWWVWEDRFGAREGVIMYSKVWEGFALAFLEVIKQALGIERFETMDDIGRLDRAFWEAIGCEYEVVEHTAERHVSHVYTCPFWDNMVDMYGKEAAGEMQKKVIGPTSANYYQALMKAVGKWDEVYVTQDHFRCLGDGECRMVYQRRRP